MNELQKAILDVCKRLDEICKKYGIRSKAKLQQWIKMYNSGMNFKYNSSGGSAIMNKERKTTFEERIEIVKYCIANDKNYALTMEKYNVSYQQIYLWVHKYEQKGIDGLIDGEWINILSEKITTTVTKNGFTR